MSTNSSQGREAREANAQNGRKQFSATLAVSLRPEQSCAHGTRPFGGTFRLRGGASSFGHLASPALCCSAGSASAHWKVQTGDAVIFVSLLLSFILRFSFFLHQHSRVKLLQSQAEAQDRTAGSVQAKLKEAAKQGVVTRARFLQIVWRGYALHNANVLSTPPYSILLL